MEEGKKRETMRDKERQRRAKVGTPWHVVAFNERKQNTRRRVTERDERIPPRKTFRFREVSRKAKGAVRYAMCEITITHP